MTEYQIPPEVLADPVAVLRLWKQLDNISIAGPWEELEDEEQTWIRRSPEGGQWVCHTALRLDYDAGEPTNGRIEVHVLEWGRLVALTSINIDWWLIYQDPESKLPAFVEQAKAEADAKLRKRGWLLMEG